MPPNFRLYRAGIYLQDHTSDGRGVHVRHASPRSRSLVTGEALTLPTQAGEIVFFDSRLTHASQFPDFLEYLLCRIAWRLRRPQLGVEIKELYWRAIGRAPKLSIFFTFGIADADTEQFCHIESRTRADHDPSARFFPPDLVHALAATGVLSHGAHGYFPTSIEPEVSPKAIMQQT